MSEHKTYTGAQIGIASNELRAIAGTEEESFTTEQAISMLGDEVRILRERGFSDERIADIFGGVDIDVTAEQLASANFDRSPYEVASTNS